MSKQVTLKQFVALNAVINPNNPNPVNKAELGRLKADILENGYDTKQPPIKLRKLEDGTIIALCGNKRTVALNEIYSMKVDISKTQKALEEDHSEETKRALQAELESAEMINKALDAVKIPIELYEGITELEAIEIINDVKELKDITYTMIVNQIKADLPRYTVKKKTKANKKEGKESVEYDGLNDGEVIKNFQGSIESLGDKNAKADLASEKFANGEIGLLTFLSEYKGARRTILQNIEALVFNQTFATLQSFVDYPQYIETSEETELVELINGWTFGISNHRNDFRLAYVDLLPKLEGIKEDAQNSKNKARQSFSFTVFEGGENKKVDVIAMRNDLPKLDELLTVLESGTRLECENKLVELFS